MDYSFIGLVVFIGEENRPIIGQIFGFHSEAMVLGGDVASVGSTMSTRLIVTSVSVPANNRMEMWKKCSLILHHLPTPQQEASILRFCFHADSLHFVGGGTNSDGQQLVTEADAEDGFVDVFIENATDVRDRLPAHLWVSRTIAQEQPIVL